MSANIIEGTASRQDFVRILQFFVDAKEDLVASRFVDAYDEALKFIAQFPELGSPWESNDDRLQNIRVKPVPGFEKYLVFYRLVQARVYILRIFHGHQDIENIF